MSEVKLTAEELHDIINTAATQASSRTLEGVFDMFGLPNDDDGRAAFMTIGKFARRFCKFGDEVESQGIRGAASCFWKVVGLTILGALAWFGFKSGIIAIPK